MNMSRSFFTFCIAIVFALAAVAVTPDERLDDPELEAKAREITQELRCLVCQNESIDFSNAGLAKELRLLVRERVLAGDTKEEVLDVVTGIYGEYVLLRPRWGLHTAVLWLSPLILLAAGFLVAHGLFRRSDSLAGRSSAHSQQIEALDEHQKELLDRLRGRDEGS